MTVRLWPAAGVIAVVVAAAHGGALWGGFHLDDRPHVIENPAIRTWEPVSYLTTGYRPVTILTLAANYALSGMNPFGYLLVNLALHALLSWMAFVVGRMVLRDDGWAAFAAVAYAAHPLNAEAVNYVVARSSLLAALGGVVAVWAMLRRRAGGAGWTALGVSAFAVGLLSKESGAAAIVPLAALAMTDSSIRVDRDASGRSARLMEAWRPVVPYAATLGVFLVAWWLKIGAGGEQRGAVPAYPLWTFLEMVVRSLGWWVAPWPLGIEHPLTFVSSFDGTLAVVLVAVVIAGLGFMVWARRRQPIAAWCVLWAVSGLLPLAPLPWSTVKGLLQENRMAFSALALAWLTALAARGLFGAVGRAAPRLARLAAVIAASAWLGWAISTDRARAFVWNDDVRLWEEAVRLAPESRSAYINLGSAYLDRNDFDRAEAANRRALAVTPNEATPYYALGVVAFRRGRDEEAWALLRKTVELAPEYAASYRLLGTIALRQGRDQDAAALFRRTIELDPRNVVARANLGLLAQRAGDEAAAERWYREAIALDPAQVLARNNLGALYLHRRQWNEALEQFSAVLTVSPYDYDAALNRAVALNALGRREHARGELEDLLRRLPPDPGFDDHRRIAAVILNRTRP